MFNEFEKNLCEYCPRCRFSTNKAGDKVFSCKYAQPHKYEITKCAHYRWHWRWTVPRVSFWQKICWFFKKIGSAFAQLFKRKKKKDDK